MAEWLAVLAAVTYVLWMPILIVAVNAAGHAFRRLRHTRCARALRRRTGR